MMPNQNPTKNSTTDDSGGDGRRCQALTLSSSPFSLLPAIFFVLRAQGWLLGPVRLIGHGGEGRRKKNAHDADHGTGFGVGL
jgi:hypothetical protein